MSLLRRLTFAIFGVLLLFSINVVTFAIGNHTIRESLDAVSDAVRGQINASTVRQGLDGLHKQVLVLITLRDSAGEGISGTEASRARSEMARIRKVVQRMTRNTNADSYPAYEALLGNSELLFGKWDQFLRELRRPATRSTSIEELKEVYQRTANALDVFEKAVMHVSSEQSAQVENTGRVIGRVTIFVFLSSIFLTSALGFLLIRHTNESLRRLREGTIRVGGGELEYQIPVLSQDEFGQLASAFNDMSEKLRTAVAEVQSARENADRANTAKSGFLANMSHELRTPLNAIIGYSEMLVEMSGDEDELPAAELSGDLQRIQTAGQHLLSLINNVLDLSKIETGKMTLFCENFDALEALRELAATMHTLAERNRNNIELKSAQTRIDILSDQTRFRQIFANLLSNACKFTAKGSICIELSTFDRYGLPWLRVEVSDTGIGMSEEQLQTVFDAFVQADSSTTKKYGGTGLGLALSREFCHLLGGTIAASSNQGEGSTFSVELPLDINAARAAATISAEAPAETPIADAPASGNCRVVLIIDDDQDACELTARALRQEGCTVMQARNGSEGLRLAREHHPDLIVLDLVMPEMDGWEVLSVLKDSEETRDIPVVLQSMMDARDESIERGANEFLDKPVNRRRLAETLQRINPRGKSGHVLLLESASPARDELISGLSEQGWYVSSTEQAGEALAMARANHPDLILLSLELPSDDVFALTEEMAQSAVLRSIPVYVMAGADLRADAQQRLESQLDKLLVQPRADIASVLTHTASLVTNPHQR